MSSYSAFKRMLSIRSASAVVWTCSIAVCLLPKPTGAQTPPACSPEDLAEFDTTMSKYQGLKGGNPAVPSTYNLIGAHKFDGEVYWHGVPVAGLGNAYVGDN